MSETVDAKALLKFKATAYHEAGHAVIALARRAAFDIVVNDDSSISNEPK